MANEPQSVALAYGSVGKRFIAVMLDSLLIVGIGFVLLFLILDSSLASTIIIILCLVLGQWLYFALMESAKGATIGKRIMNLKVVDPEGNSISFGRATGRYFGKSLSGILFIGYIMAFFTEKKQALHDILAGTVVIEVSPAPEVQAKEPSISPDTELLTLEPEKPVSAEPVDPALEAFGVPDATATRVLSDRQTATPAETAPKPVPGDAKTCPSCKNVVGQYQTKCHHCGSKLKRGMF